MDSLIQTGEAFALLMLIFLPLERLFPAHDQPVFRREWGTDLLFFLGQYLLWTAPVVAVLVAVSHRIDLLPLGGIRSAVAGMPMLAQIVVALLVSDCCIYWMHRLSHRVPFLWRFHRVHHTAERLDWLAAHREHPFDNLYTRLVENLPILILGVPLHLLAGFALFRGMWAILIHSNVALPVGKLGYVLGTPRLHHWHHAAERDHCNYANLMPLMDVLFGTYYDPGHLPAGYGIREASPRGYVAQLVTPLVPDRALEALRARTSHGTTP